MTDLAPPDLSKPLRIAEVEGGYVVPPAKGLGNQSVQKSGVLDADGRLVPESVTWRGRTQVTTAPALPDEAEALEGTWLFLGPLFGHFGHFLVESIARIWALDAVRDRIAGALYVPKFQNRPQYVMDTYRPFLRALGVDVEVRNVEDPTRVERVLVPEQGFGMFQMIEGSREFRDFIGRHAGKDVEPAGDERIYVSRSALPPQRGSVVGEDVLEARLRAEGYTVYHPQQHDHLEQIAAYKAAKDVIGVDCSPLHLLALVGNAEQNVGIIARRAGELDKIFERQIAAFTGAKATGIDHLRRNWIEESGNRPSRTSRGEVDFAALGRSLSEAGLISDGDWDDLTPEEIEADIARTAEAAGQGYKPYEG
ncbi:DUF563 domain-containing protein [Jannaschia sp. Os4]|uniref:glycosyltransferase family 61 protein n=1 Tax=Jannaschia sp. Os4 TaxID=2807617 RepID=UPI0019397CCA|nr:glycosyltransferase 61 family protein [Jannaschia sp. Os4]MBM2576475.1 DUF563 domain-containing protein [Jannaschia sp. Os4]